MALIPTVCGIDKVARTSVCRLASLLRRDGVWESPWIRPLTERLGAVASGRNSLAKRNTMRTKTTIAQRALSALVLSLGLVVLSRAALAKEMTAFELAKEGNRYIGEQSKDKVVQIRSDKSVGTLNPNLWYIVYYDPDATFRAVEVKFGAGAKMDVKRTARLLEPIANADEPLPREKLKVDSDKALDIATKQPLLEKLTLKASRLVLERRGFDDHTPVWKIRLWAAKLKNPGDTADLGEVVVSAEDGTVLKSDLKPERVD
jgi:hypothetical protein